MNLEHLTAIKNTYYCSNWCTLL